MVGAARSPIRPRPATCSDAANAPEKRKVGGSTPPPDHHLTWDNVHCVITWARSELRPAVFWPSFDRQTDCVAAGHGPAGRPGTSLPERTAWRIPAATRTCVTAVCLVGGLLGPAITNREQRQVLDHCELDQIE